MAQSVTSNHPINGFSIFTLIVFILVNVLVVFPIRIPLPRILTKTLIVTARKARILSIPTSPPPSSQDAPDPNHTLTSPTSRTVSSSPSSEPTAEPDELLEKRHHFSIDLSTAPVIGVLLLLASTSIPGGVVRTGIVGSGGVKPYDIMTLFISLAYISLSLDCTGLLRFMAFWVALKGGTSGKKLYFYFFLFFFFFGVIVGNDPIILSGTSFLAYFSRIAGISPPRAWIFMQFASCNIASAVLVSSNPTNLVLTGAYDVSFLVFSAWTVLPVLATGLVLFPILLFGVFKGEDYIPEKLVTPDVDPNTALIDRTGAIFGSTLLGITLALLVGLSAGGLLHGVEGVWTVTAPAAIIMLGRDVWYDMNKGHRAGKTTTDEVVGSSRQAGGGGDDDDDQGIELELQGREDLNGSVGMVEGGKATHVNERDERDALGGEDAMPAQSTMRSRNVTMSSGVTKNTSGPPSKLSTPGQSPSTPPKSSLQSAFHQATKTLPTASHIIARLPLPLLPFAFSMFILVEALSYVGWIRVFGGWWASWVKVGGLGGAVVIMGILSVLGCNAFGTNIGATILLSRVLQQWSQSEGQGQVSKRILFGSLYTLALGSNYGAFSFTFSASLAGLLWKNILQQKGIQVGRWEFAKYNAAVVVVCMVVGVAVVVAEVCVIY